MPPLPDIPGYYYDVQKKKYFKVEKSQTAPAGAEWSADNVKRRRVADDEARVKARWKAKASVPRAKLFGQPALGGFLAREHGASRMELEDVPRACHAGGLVPKGELFLFPEFGGQENANANMPFFYINSDDEATGLGVVYATLEEESLVSSYMSIDSNDRIVERYKAGILRNTDLSQLSWVHRCKQITSINYHSASNKVLVTSREPSKAGGIWVFSPGPSDPDNSRPQRLLRDTSNTRHLTLRGSDGHGFTYQTTIAPPGSSNLIATVGANTGVMLYRSNNSLSWLTPGIGDVGIYRSEILTQDFLPGNPNVLLAAGRAGHVCLIDMRVPNTDWQSFGHGAPVSNLRLVNGSQVLVAGIRHRMMLYDLRFRKDRGPRLQEHPGPGPVVVFPEYRNEAHVANRGWDVDVEKGIVATANDDGSVALFSVYSGKRLSSPAVDKAHSRSLIRCLRFRALPTERNASLFLGVGSSIRKFSFGAESEDEEC